MRDLRVTAAFEHIERADDVALDVGVRFLQRMPHPGLSAQMHDAFKFLLGEQRAIASRRPNPQARSEKRMRLQPREPRVLSDTS